MRAEPLIVLCVVVFAATATPQKDVADTITDALSTPQEPVTEYGNLMRVPQFWIGVAFASILLVFFMVAYFKSKDMTRVQWQILRFFGALCAASAGAFLAGGALFQATGNAGAMNYAISGTTGFALFFVVWFTWVAYEPTPLLLDMRISFSVQEGSPFVQTVNALVDLDNSFVDMIGFSQDELNTPLRARHLTTPSVKAALEQLGRLAPPGAIRSYEVQGPPPAYSLRIGP